MDLYNKKLGYRWNMFFRDVFYVPRKRKQLNTEEVSILCNNCTAGFILHDLNLKFNTPTINMFFAGTDFFDFVEHLEFYINQSLVEYINLNDIKSANYPIAILPGNGEFKDLELHFLHYKSFDEANNKWEERKQRINWDKLFVIWSFVGSIDENDNSLYYDRAQNLPVENKVIFVNHPVDKNKYPSFFYIKGYEHEEGLGVLSHFINLKGERYYDQFDYINWLNQG